MSLSPSSDRLASPSTFSRARKSPFPLAPSPSSPILSDHLLLPAPSPPDLPSHLAPVFHNPLRKEDFVTRFPLPNIPLEYALLPNNPYWQVSVRLPQRRTNPFLDVLRQLPRKTTCPGGSWLPGTTGPVGRWQTTRWPGGSSIQDMDKTLGQRWNSRRTSCRRPSASIGQHCTMGLSPLKRCIKEFGQNVSFCSHFRSI